jgi:hypothetical protein
MRASLLLVAGLCLAACGHENAGDPSSPANPAPSPQMYAVATAAAGGDILAAGLSGVLHGKTNDDKTACFWLEPTPKAGSPGEHVAVVWPHGSRAYANPLRVVNAKGEVIGAVGRTVSLTGGFIGPGTVPLIGCPDVTSAFGT